MPHREYLRALRFAALTPHYDRSLAVLLHDRRFRLALVRQMRLAPGFRVLDVGCGTASLTILVKQAQPSARVIGLDADPGILALARHKITASGLDIDLQQGLADRLPFAPASFERVVSCLVFHHLTPRQKRRALAEVRRVLCPHGELHLADWGQPQNALMRLAYLVGVQILDGFTTTTENVRGHLIPLMRAAGFTEVEETERRSTIFGTLSLYRAVNPPTQDFGRQ
jgi:ubiquinone/menaquinone biosynthesis C-methylase UbiE